MAQPGCRVSLGLSSTALDKSVFVKMNIIQQSQDIVNKILQFLQLCLRFMARAANFTANCK